MTTPSDTPPPSASTLLAVDRTQLAHDRTLLAWVRTATSLISFGFTIYKFFQYLRDQNKVSEEGRLIGPRGFAMLMIGTGLVALLLATIQHRRDLVKLRRHYPQTEYSLATVLAGLLSIIGILAITAVIFRQ